MFGCTAKSSKKTVWIYTSIYQHVVEKIEEKLKGQFPGVEFKWYQAGSENVASKINAELLAGKTQADLIMTSDVFWYEDLAAKGVLESYQSSAAEKVPAYLRDPENYWVAARVPVGVIAYNSDSYSEQNAPKGFQDLTRPEFKDKVAMGNPLESGSVFTAVAMISRKYGWDYFKALRANNVISAGGNSAVIGRIETKERPVGIVLLENVLTASRKNPKIKAVYPSDGVVLVPSPIAMTKNSANPDLVKKVYDYFFSPEIQAIIAEGDMYAIFPETHAPVGAKPFAEILAMAMPWDQKVVKEIAATRADIKAQFSKIVLE